MLSKQVSTITLVAILMSISNHVFASDRGWYVGIQAGYTDTNLNKLPMSDVLPDFKKIVNTIPGTSVNGVAINAIAINSIDVTSFNSRVNDRVFTGRLFTGYSFYPTLALEGGLTNFRSSSMNYDASLNANSTVVANNINLPVTATVGSDTRHDMITQYAIDFLVKGVLPLNYGVNIYSKVGWTILFTQIQHEYSIGSISNVVVSGVPVQPGNKGYSLTTKNRTSKGYPTIVIGMEYFFQPNTGVDLSYSKILVNSGGNDNINFLSIGILYNI
jgi:hypothetical protein